MRLLIDANILLDVLQNRTPHVKTSSLIWKLCETKTLDGYISSLTFANLVYVMRKQLSPKEIKGVFTSFSLIFTIADLSQLDLKYAANLEWNDYEDAIQYATAKRLNVQHIITRNVKDYDDIAESSFVLTPSDFLNKLNL